MPAALTCSWILNFGLGYWVLSCVVTYLSSQLFVYSESKLIFMYFFAYLNAVLAFCYWVSTLFSRSKTAAIAGIMIYFGGYIITEGVKESNSHAVKLAASIHPVAAFIFGLNSFVEYEDTQIGITTYTWDVTTNKDEYTFRDCILMLVFDIFFWGFMTYYCENVLPSEWGTHKHPFFCVDPRFWFGGVKRTSYDVMSEESAELLEHVETPSTDLVDSIKRGEGINIVNLRKR